MSEGYASPYRGNILQLIAYLVLQELATRISHRNTGLLSTDPVCDRLLGRIAQDENLHMMFYRDLFAAALELLPGEALTALDDVVASFQMPGAGIPGFARKSVAIANAGIYDPQIHLEDLAARLARLEKVAGRFVDRRDSRVLSR